MPKISKRQEQICELLAEGKSVAETAEALGVSPSTVRSQINRMRVRFDVLDHLGPQELARVVRRRHGIVRA